jgi:hypothetical protein
VSKNNITLRKLDLFSSSVEKTKKEVIHLTISLIAIIMQRRCQLIK